MEIPLDEVVYFDVITSTPSTGAAVDADSTPTFAVYEEATDTDIGVGGNLTKRTSLTGNYRGSFTVSSANGFEVGKWYNVIASATVGAVAGKCVAKNFRLVAATPAVAADVPTANANADALLDRTAGVETNRTLRQAMRLMLSVMVGKVSGAATATNTFRDTNDSIDRVVSTVDADGNRSVVTLDAS